MKRYAVTIDLYVYAKSDEDAKLQSEQIAKHLDLDDNKSSVQSIHEQSFGQLTSRKVK